MKRIGYFAGVVAVALLSMASYIEIQNYLNPRNTLKTRKRFFVNFAGYR